MTVPPPPPPGTTPSVSVAGLVAGRIDRWVYTSGAWQGTHAHLLMGGEATDTDRLQVQRMCRNGHRARWVAAAASGGRGWTATEHKGQPGWQCRRRRHSSYLPCPCAAPARCLLARAHALLGWVCPPASDRSKASHSPPGCWLFFLARSSLLCSCSISLCTLF
jgi:hypothetical protein